MMLHDHPEPHALVSPDVAQALLDHSGDWIVLFDDRHRFVTLNQVAT